MLSLKCPEFVLDMSKKRPFRANIVSQLFKILEVAMNNFGEKIVGNSLVEVWTRYVSLTYNGTMGVDNGQAIREQFGVTIYFTPKADFESVHPLMDIARQVQYVKKTCSKEKSIVEEIIQEFGVSYAARIFNGVSGDQFETAVTRLIECHESKSAIINLSYPSEQEQKIQLAIRRIACLIHIQPLIRDEQLHFFAHFRSQNAWNSHGNFKALYELQRLMLSHLDKKGLKVNLGRLTVMIAAAHLYEPDFKKAMQLINDFE